MHTNHEPDKSSNRYWGFIGLFAFLWLIIRSLENPKRLAYPCQRAAMPLAFNWILSVIAFVTGSLIIRKFAKVSAIALLLIAIFWFTFTLTDYSSANTSSIASLRYWEVSNPVSKVFVLDSIPPTKGTVTSGNASAPDSCLDDPAIDSLFLILASNGTYFHKTTTHPTGIVGSNDVVIIKGNFQWRGKVSTSTDRIKGTIWQILNHPDGFTGEIIVCDNTQYISNAIDVNDNNSEDTTQTILDVVNTFHAKGYPVFLLDWKYINTVDGLEYSQGDYKDCYIYDTPTKVSYPKFRTPSGKNLVSLRYGIWDSLATHYDSSRLCIINFPVLKHHSMAGATIAVKNWIGVMSTDRYDTRYGSWDAMHYTYLFSQYALVARIMAVTYPKLSIVDAAWTSRWGNTTPDQVTNTKMLLASTDPVAVSWYAAKFILTPIASRPAETNPDLVDGKYHNCLTNWTIFLRDSAGFPCTMDSTKISVFGRSSITPVVKPATPTLVSPANGATDQSTVVTLIWDHALYASVYHLQVATDSIFSNLILDDSVLTSPTYHLDALVDTTTYYWHVCAKNDAGASDYSSTWHFTTGYQSTMAIEMNAGWNIISLPLATDENSLADLFPSAISDAFAYISGSYQSQDTLRNGSGYWLKFSSDQSILVGGEPTTADTVDVAAGWNLIGSLSSPIYVGNITSIPPQIITTSFWKYDGSSYVAADTIYPGKGYWVKVSESGKLILSTTATASTMNRIQIVHSNELPPLPPQTYSSEDTKPVPAGFELQQNYPNPFNASTVIKYGLPNTAHVRLGVYDILGHRVAMLADERQDAGYHEATFDAIGLTSGLYFYWLQAGDVVLTKKLLLLK
jgi:hypothetical protein